MICPQSLRTLVCRKTRRKKNPGPRTQNDIPFFLKEHSLCPEDSQFHISFQEEVRSVGLVLRGLRTQAPQQDRYSTRLPSDQLNAAKTSGPIFPLCSELFAPAIPIVHSEVSLVPQGVHSALRSGKTVLAGSICCYLSEQIWLPVRYLNSTVE